MEGQSAALTLTTEGSRESGSQVIDVAETNN